MFEAFTTYFRENPDYSYQDALNEAKFLFHRQQIIQDFLSGKASLEQLLSLFEEQGINPDDYVDAVSDNLDILGLR